MTKIYKQLFLDTETTGLNFETSQIIELGIIDDTGRVVYFKRFDLRPEYNQSNTETDQALSYNNVSRQELALSQEMTATDLEDIAALLNNSEQVIAHNSDFDRQMIENAARVLSKPSIFDSVNWACSMTIYAKKLGYKSGRVKLPNTSLESIAHSVISDCNNCRLLYQSLTGTQPPTWEF